MRKRELLALLDQPVLVTWLDAEGVDSGWHDRSEFMAAELPVIKTVSRLVGVTKNAVKLATDVNGDVVAGTCHIPLAMVQSVVRLVPDPS